MSDPLYGKELLRLAAEAHGAGRLAAPDATGVAFNPACGDKVTVDIALAKGRIAALAHETRACILAQVSASILGRSLARADRLTTEHLRAVVEEMLARNAASPPPPFEDYSVLLGAAEFPSRHRCVLLPIDAVLDAFRSLDQGNT
jgi:nitrogen fixation NifU-like protein